MTTANALLAVFGYLLGSISSAVVVARLMGLPDPRTQGSGNPGATNMLRVGGRKAAVITLLGDMLKGVIPVLVAHLGQAPIAVVAGVGLAAFLGHLYPVFFGFRGGKGVATALGVLVAAAWQVGVATVATWLAVFALTRISSLSALVAFALAPVYAWLLHPQGSFVAAVAAISVLLIWRHRSNIRKLLAGTEDKSRVG
ncbi:MAG: glycerol-3-phosphate 1-O-acyltransferase PlsY [Gammaproteobacteria bacterium]